MDKSKLTAQEAFRLTKGNQAFSANSNRMKLLESIAEILNQKISSNARLGFQHVFISFESQEIISVLEKYQAQIQDVEVLIRETVSEVLNAPKNTEGNFAFKVDPNKYNYRDARGYYITWGEIYDDVIQGGTDLDSY